MMDIFNCKICEEEYGGNEKRVPRILHECGHTLCEDCLLSIMKDSAIICPFDRIKTVVQNGQMKSLKKNFGILEAMEELRLEIQTVEDVNVVEDGYENERKLQIPCDENEKHIAVFFCNSCSANFCEKCSKKIHSPKVLKTHDIVKVTEKPEPLLYCPNHPSSVAELYCLHEDCGIENKVTCSTCHLNGEHKNHPYDSMDTECERTKSSIESILCEISKKQKSIEEYLTTIGTVADDVETDADYIKLMEKLEQKFKKSRELLKSEVRMKIESLTQQRTRYLNSLDILTDLRDVGNKALKSGKAEILKRRRDFDRVNFITVPEPRKVFHFTGFDVSPIQRIIMKDQSYISSIESEVSDEKAQVEEVCKKVRSILNKITKSSKEELIAEFIALNVSSNENLLEKIVDMIFERSIQEPQYCELYVEICNAQVERDVIISGLSMSLFREKLLKRMQITHDRKPSKILRDKLNSLKQGNPFKNEWMKREIGSEIKWNRRKFGNICLTGYFHRYQLIDSKIVCNYISELLNSILEQKSLTKEAIDEKSAQCALQLIYIVGGQFDKKQENQLFLDKLFFTLYGAKHAFSNKIRFSILNLIELRNNKWVLKNASDSVQFFPVSPIF